MRRIWWTTRRRIMIKVLFATIHLRANRKKESWRNRKRIWRIWNEWGKEKITWSGTQWWRGNRSFVVPWVICWLSEQLIALIKCRANSLRRAIKQLAEHTELVIDDHNNTGGGKRNKLPNITITGDIVPSAPMKSKHDVHFSIKILTSIDVRKKIIS